MTCATSAAGSPSSRPQHLHDARTILRLKGGDVFQSLVCRRGYAIVPGGRALSGDVCHERICARQLAAHRPKEHGSCDEIPDVGQVQFHRAVEQAALEGLHVAPIQAAGDEDRGEAADDGKTKQGRLRRRRRREQHRANEGATDRIPQSVDADVDQRFRGPFVHGGHRRVEDFVARTEERRTKRRFPAARHGHARQPWRRESTDGTGKHCQRRRTRRRTRARASRGRRGSPTSAPRTR